MQILTLKIIVSQLTSSESLQRHLKISINTCWDVGTVG